MATEEEQQVPCAFTTQLEERWRVPEAPIELPTRLTRAGLSEVINHLLAGKDSSHVSRPFDFLVKGELLRGSLGQTLIRHGLTGETAVDIEYIECLPPPEPKRSYPSKDWVSALAAHPSGGRLLLSGSYDNSAYVWDESATPIAHLSGHTGAVKAVAWLRGASASGGGGGGGTLRAASASKDHTVRTWSIQMPAAAGGAVACACEAVLTGHAASVESLVANLSLIHI